MVNMYQTLICASSNSLCTSNASLHLVLKKAHFINILKSRIQFILNRLVYFYLFMSSMCFMKKFMLKLSPGNINDIGSITSVVKLRQMGVLFCFETKAYSFPFLSFKKGEQEK